jgi:putative DNA primase/helicase
MDAISPSGAPSPGLTPADSGHNDTEDSATENATRPCYGFNDHYLAYKTVQLYGHRIRYCRKLGGFFIWNGAKWVKDETGAVWRATLDAAWDLYHNTRQTASEKEQLRLKKWIVRAERCSSIESAIKQLQASPEILASAEAFDSDPWLFNVKNGTIDLRTGELRQHQQQDLITSIAPVEYDPVCPPPDRWMRFLAEIFDGNHNLITFIQRACGYALTGSVSEQKLFFLHGSGANGKTTFLKTLMFVMGDYTRRLPSSLLLTARQDKHPTGFADLKGIRFAVTTEVEFGSRLAEATVKELTGGDVLTARRIGQDYFEFEPTHKIFMCGNHLPLIQGTDHAIWRRIALIPFNVTIPDERQDKDLDEKLRSEAAGILNWLISGCLDWQKKGLADPAEVIDATRIYRTDMDVLGDFLNDRCLIAPGARITSADLNRAHKEWCEKNGEQPMNARSLGLRLKERGFKQERTMSTRLWQGLCLKEKSS